MTPLLVNILAFSALFFAVFAANALLIDMHSSERRRVRQRLEEQFRGQQRERAQSAPLVQDFSRIAAEAAAESSQKPTFRQRYLVMAEQSGLDVAPARMVTLTAVSGLVCALVLGLFVKSILLGLLAGAMGAALPLLYIQIKRRQRMNRLRAQLPDAFDLMSRVMRAGQTVSQAMQAVAEEFSQPISAEFLYCHEQMNLGLSADAALRELARRTGLLEIKIFVLAVLVHRQTGGNLAELLDKLAHVVRERFRISGMIRSLTAQGRFQAGILLSLPPLMFCLLMVLHREYEMLLLQYPMMIAAALTLMLVGALWIHKVVSFEF